MNTPNKQIPNKSNCWLVVCIHQMLSSSINDDVIVKYFPCPIVPIIDMADHDSLCSIRLVSSEGSNIFLPPDLQCNKSIIFNARING